MRFKPDGMSLNAWAVRAGVSRTVWADMRRHGNPSRRTLERLLTAAGSSLAEFEALRVGPASTARGTDKANLSDITRQWGPAPLPPLPLVATSAGGHWQASEGSVELIVIERGRCVQRLPRPPSLARDPDAFALTILNETMWPRFARGARIAVSPLTAVASGDDVFVTVRDASAESAGELGLVMRLAGKTRAAISLRQFNPDLSFTLEKAKVAAVMKIAGELF